MAQFRYNALDSKDAYVKGVVEARNAKRAVEKLEAEGLLVINVKSEKPKGFSLNDFIFHRLLHRVSALEKIFFTRNLHTTLESGIAVDQGLKIAAEQTTNPTLKVVTNDLYQRILKGENLASSLGHHKQFFSDFYINLVRVGESSGKLDEVLAYLLEQQERDYDLRTKARGAMVYPVLILSALVCMVVLMMVFVVPKVTGVLNQYEVQLPLATRILIGLSDFLLRFGIFLIPVLVALGFLFARWTKSGRGRMAWDRFLLRLPKVGKIIAEFNLARYTRAMASLLKSGVAIDQALATAASVPQNIHYQEAARGGIQFVQRGIPLTEVLKGSTDLFPPLTVRMVEIGERSGKLDHMLERLATFYEKSVEATLANLASVIEPALLLGIGLAVGFVAIAVLTPIWSFSNTI
jgi:type II secretory pathway component PulF